MDRVVLAWSGGKDAAFALHRLTEAGVDVVALMTTVTEAYDRSSMHGVRRELYERQAAALGLPLDVVALPIEPSNEEYDAIMARVLGRYEERGIDEVAFGDLFLGDVRAYREDRLADTGLAGRWPLWGLDTADLLERFLDAGFRATVVAVDGGTLDPSFAGRELDARFVEDLPDGVDPCGENGEFHTFVWDAPGFEAPLPVTVADRVTRSVGGTPFHYADLVER